jgi:hypothetical protein
MSASRTSGLRQQRFETLAAQAVRRDAHQATLAGVDRGAEAAHSEPLVGDEAQHGTGAVADVGAQTKTLAEGQASFRIDFEAARTSCPCGTHHAESPYRLRRATGARLLAETSSRLFADTSCERSDDVLGHQFVVARPLDDWLRDGADLARPPRST